MAHQSFQEWVNPSEIPCSPSTPFLIILSGLSGSGKSTVSQFLAEQYQAAWISADIERKKLYGLKPGESGKDIPGFYSMDTTRKIFAHMAYLARQLLERKYPVILDSCALKLSERDEFARIARNGALPYIIIFCEAPLQVLTDRVENRQKTGKDASDATTKIIKMQEKWLEPPNSDSNEKLIRLDTTVDNWQSLINKAIKKRT